MNNLLDSLNNDFERALALQNTLLDRATGKGEDDIAYLQLRNYFLNYTSFADHLPQFVRTCRSLSQFWQHIKKTDGYASRREIIWTEFQPLLDMLEGKNSSPSDNHITEGLKSYDEAGVNEAWAKALDRRAEDPEGAITAARSLIETVCKHILDDRNITYDRNTDMSELYKLAAKELNLAPDQHGEQIFKQILKGCSSVVNGLGTLRNKYGDAHGIGKKPPKPADRHALLAVNLAGSMAVFLIQTWQKFNQN
ncbi:abortive infection family protein [Atlantibacter subterraneus]|uniref:abortive infection family protein n=1 Tax=Atlantibacter subterraneus TaxID=255519 RepID=UPI002963D13C|nr:abortive infection family protein [Atlantibacter subterranea]MDW2744817.1 abortive infection family protein [Atlantibacter subterranea]